MKAIVFDQFGGPDVLHLSEMPTPEPGVGEIRVLLRAASVIPGDWKLRAGLLQAYFPIRFPKIPGRDGAGVVDKIGPGVSEFQVGDRVCVATEHTQPGTYAQSVAVSAESAVKLDDALDFAHGASLMHAGVCAWTCLVDTAKIQAGMRVLIHAGAGSIGGASVQLAHHLGCAVTATCRQENANYVRSLGADEIVAYDKEDFSRLDTRFDVVLDLLGGEVHRNSYRVLKRGGHMVCLIAKPYEDQSAEHGVRVSRPMIHDSKRVLQAVMDLASNGALKAQIAGHLPLEQASEAHRRLEANSVSRGRIVLDIS